MAEAVFTSKKIKELSHKYSATFLAAPHAVLPRLSEHLLMSDRPGNAGDRYCERKEPDELQGERHARWTENTMPPSGIHFLQCRTG